VRDLPRRTRQGDGVSKPDGYDYYTAAIVRRVDELDEELEALAIAVASRQAERTKLAAELDERDEPEASA